MSLHILNENAEVLTSDALLLVLLQWFQIFLFVILEWCNSWQLSHWKSQFNEWRVPSAIKPIKKFLWETLFLSAQYFIFCVLVSFARSLTPLQKLTYWQNTPGIQFTLLQNGFIIYCNVSHIMSQHVFIGWTTYSSRTSASIINDTWNKCYSDNTEQWNIKWTNYVQVRCMAEQSSLPLQQHLSIHLVYSVEGSCHLPSLDSDSYRSKNEYLDQNFHRKPAYNEQCQNATAHHHLAQKFCISNTIHMANIFKEEDLQSELAHLRNAMETSALSQKNSRKIT